MTYPGALPQDTDILSPQRNAMIATGFALAATFGTSTVADGLVCAQTTVASMSVDVGPGAVMTNLTVDSSSYGSLAADTSDALVKMGINIATTAIGPFTAPATAGDSQNFLIEAQVSETDGSPVVLPYYNASTPSSPYSGPANAGTPQNTTRNQTVLLQVKAGAPATTGSQVTPTPDAGFVGLYQITIANGATTIVNGDISQYPGAPFITLVLPAVPAAIQAQAGNYARDTSSTANVITVAYTPALTSYVGGLLMRFNIASANTGATTINVNGLGAMNLLNVDGSSLTPGQLSLGSSCLGYFDGANVILLSASAPGKRSFTGYNGWTITPDGTIDQTIQITASAMTAGYTTTLVTLPIAFPNAALDCPLICYDGVLPPTGVAISAEPYSNSQVRVTVNNPSGGSTVGVVIRCRGW